MMDKRTSVGMMAPVMGAYTQMQVADSIPLAAQNPSGVAGLGMGIAYSPLSLTVLDAARPGEEGSASAALQLSDTLGVAVGTGLGGSIVALGDARGWAVSSSVAVVFVASLAVLVGGLLAAGRLPEQVPAQAR